MNVKIEDKEDSTFQTVNSVVQFVRFGGSQKLTKGINDKNKGEKFQENIVVNSDSAAMQRIIYGLYTGQKAVNYDSSRLMKLVKNSLNHNSSIYLLACLNPNEANFEDSLNTLTLLDRCNNYEELNKDGGHQMKEMDKKVKEWS